MLWFLPMVDVFCFIVALQVLVLGLALVQVLELALVMLFFALLSHRLLLACR